MGTCFGVKIVETAQQQRPRRPKASAGIALYEVHDPGLGGGGIIVLGDHSIESGRQDKATGPVEQSQRFIRGRRHTGYIFR